MLWVQQWQQQPAQLTPVQANYPKSFRGAHQRWRVKAWGEGEEKECHLVRKRNREEEEEEEKKGRRRKERWQGIKGEGGEGDGENDSSGEAIWTNKGGRREGGKLPERRGEESKGGERKFLAHSVLLCYGLFILPLLLHRHENIHSMCTMTGKWCCWTLKSRLNRGLEADSKAESLAYPIFFPASNMFMYDPTNIAEVATRQHPGICWSLPW